MKKTNNILTALGITIINISTLCTGINFINQNTFYLKLLAIILISLSLLSQQKNTTSVTNKWFLLLIISVISFIASGSLILPYFTLLSICTKNIDFKTILKIDTLSKITVIIINLLSLLLPNPEHINSLGFLNKNHLGFIVFSIYIDILFLLNEKAKRYTLKKNLTMIIIILLLFFYNCRTAGIILIFYALLQTKTGIKYSAKFFHFITKYGVTILTILSIIATIAFTSQFPIAVSANKALNGRLWYQQQYIDKYNISPLGNNIETFSGAPLDNAYIRVLINLGVIGIITIIAIYYSIGDKILKDNDKKLMPYYISILLYGLSEAFIIQTAISPLLLYNGKKQIRQKK